MAAKKNDPIQMLLARLSKVTDPEERAKEATKLLSQLSSAGKEAKIIRQKALEELVAQGWTYAEIGEMIGVNKARVYQILNGMSGNTDKYLGT